MKIVYECRDFAVVEKAVGTPSEPDPTGIPDVLTLLSETYRTRGEPSDVYPVHRLDLGVGGLLAVARTKRGAAGLSEEFAGGRVGKTYLAIAEGHTPPEETLTCLLFHDRVTAKAVVCPKSRPGAKSATLSYRAVAFRADPDATLLSVTLATGRYHQIRAQLAGRGNPLFGDRKYGAKHGGQVALFCARLTFSFDGKPFTFTLAPDVCRAPWNLFDPEEVKLP